jgi:UDP-glucose 4-epimerase
MRSVLVSGADTPLGRGVLESRRDRDDFVRGVGIEPTATTKRLDGVELVSFNSDHRELFDFIAHHQVDTVIHCSLAPDRSGGRPQPSEARVIETMRIGASIAHEGSPVRAWVVASSSDVYPVGSASPLMNREDSGLDTREGTIAASLVEAEGYARDVAERTAHLNVSILRLQQLVGEGIRSPIASLLDQPILPNVIGYDAPLQVLAIEDAVAALVYAAEYELAGVYNVASAGVLRYSEARHVMGRRALPVLPIEAGPLGPLAQRIGIPHVPEGLLGLMLYGHAIDTSKLASAGFLPDRDLASCLEELRS